MMMRAVQCHQFDGIEGLTIDQISRPDPKDHEVLIEVDHAGLNFPDLLAIQGLYQIKASLPFTPGVEVAGTIVSTGAGVTRLKARQRVLAVVQHGGLAEYCCAPESSVVPIPDQLPMAQAAGLAITCGTALHALSGLAGLDESSTLLVLGAAGGVGTAAVSIARCLGARVIAAASTDDKLAFARKAGADELIHTERDSIGDRIKVLAPEGVNVVFDPVGGSQAIDALKSLAWQGRYLVIGFASGDIPSIPANQLLLREATVQGVWWGQWLGRNPAGGAADFMRLMRWIGEGRLTLPEPEIISLDEVQSGFERIQNRQVTGKVVIRIGQ